MEDHHLILRVVARILVAPIFLFGLYVQFHGEYGPGGGFQAGIIFAVGFILYGTIFSLRQLREKFPDHVIHRLMALGVLLYGGTGVVGMILGDNFLNYMHLGPTPLYGQLYGIIAVELGVGVAVFSVMLSVYYAFAGRPGPIDDKDW
ncbi:MAG: Na(+)/H(+) antiporter subunit B [Pseudomonadota bacterium]